MPYTNFERGSCRVAVNYDTYANLIMAVMFMIGTVVYEHPYILTASYIGVFGVVTYFLNVAEYAYQRAVNTPPKSIEHLMFRARILNHASLLFFVLYVLIVLAIKYGII